MNQTENNPMEQGRMPEDYDFHEIEGRWQSYWDENGT